MGKIMQVISKNTDFKKGAVNLELYQTGFQELTKVVGSVEGQTLENAQTNTVVGYQFFQDLNNKQLDVRNYIDNKFKIEYNKIIEIKKGKVPTLYNFDYSWTSCVDYKNNLHEGMNADYALLTRIVTAEKELHDYRVYSQQHIKKNCEIMAKWSEDKNYLSNLSSFTLHWGGPKQWQAEFQFYTTGFKQEMKTTFTGPSDEYITIPKSFLEKIPYGGTGTCRLYNTQGNITISTYDVKVYKIENDSYFTLNNTYNAPDLINRTWYTYSRTGQPATHFKDTTSEYNLKFFKTRVLI